MILWLEETKALEEPKGGRGQITQGLVYIGHFDNVTSVCYMFI